MDVQSENQIDLQSDIHPVFQEQGSPKISFLDMDDSDDADVLLSKRQWVQLCKVGFFFFKLSHSHYSLVYVASVIFRAYFVHPFFQNQYCAAAMIYTYQHLLLISVCFFLMPLVDSASVPVPPPAPMQDQPVFSAWSDRSDERLVRITSAPNPAPNPEEAAGSTKSSDQEFALELGGGVVEVVLCCSDSGADSQLACIEGT